MVPIAIQTRVRTLLADTITPVGVYLNLRDRFANSFLLESADYNASNNSFSYICCCPMAFFKAEAGEVHSQLPNQPVVRQKIESLRQNLMDFIASFVHDKPNDHFIRSGLFGYLTYDASTELSNEPSRGLVGEPTAVAQYHLFQFVIALDHFRNECHVVEAYTNRPDDLLFEEVFHRVRKTQVPAYSFRTTGPLSSSNTDESYRVLVQDGIRQCLLGNVFQLVLARSFSVPFVGDEFQVYRQLRSINPSPYLFYFDYGGFRLFGSSPEAQLILRDGLAEIHPIAGTFRRTGNDAADSLAAQRLLEDPKENAEHIMLVDLARNDLSRHCDFVQVEKYRDVQYYSHVIHLVSKVTGRIRQDSSFMDVVADTFPAGTLSGAPKVRAMQLIGLSEEAPRGFYGGAVGFMDFLGNFNHAIMIRSFLSRHNTLKFQAGAGVVARSSPDSELQEVYNKVGALQRAIELASCS